MSPKYKKRVGTSGIRGQLYESKLISLIYFRVKHGASVRDFLLATNMDEVGAFDDICLRVKLKGVEKPLVVFVQAKHRENDNSVLTLSKQDLTQYFYSYLNIRRAFSPLTKGVLFEGTYDAMECLFVMYTTAKDADNSKPYESPVAKHLNELIATGKSGVRPRYTQKDVEFLSHIVIQDQVATLAGQLAKCLCEHDCRLSMNNELMLCYHVLLAQTVLDVGRIQRRGEDSEHRLAHFRPDFFTASDEFLKLFRDTLVLQLLRNQTLDELQEHALLTSLFTEPSEQVLSELIECVLTYRQGKLHFLREMDDALKQQLFHVNVSPATVEQATNMAAQRILTRKTIKVPVTFGNNDLTIRGQLDVDIEHVLNELTSKIVRLLQDSDPDNVVLDESLGSEFLQLNRGIASAVGNILVRGDNVNSMKFTDEPEALGDLAKRLYDKVRQEIPDINAYRLVVRTKRLPLLSFDMGEDGVNMEVVQRDVTALAVTMAKFLNEEVSLTSLMDDELVLRYHVVLEQKAIDVSDIQQQHDDGEHRIASFRQELFDTDEELLQLFKRTLYMETLKRRKYEESETSRLLSAFYEDTSDIASLSKLIGNVVTYDNGKLQFVHETSEDFKEQLSRVNVTQSSVDEAIELAAGEILTQMQFQVPAAFGNKDLTIKGKKGFKIERRLNHLNMKISELSVVKIVTVDDSLDDELLRQGLAGAVSNILVLDKETNLLKFVEDDKSLGPVSRMLFQSLLSRLPDMSKYRFDMKAKCIPKLLHTFQDEDNCHFEKTEMSALAQLIADYIYEETDGVMSINDDRLSQYHVILAEQALDVSDIQRDHVGAHRIASFRKEFFDTNDQLMKLFRDKLYLETLKRRKLDESELEIAITTFCQFPTDVTFLSNLIGNVITFQQGKLQLVQDIPEDLKKQLNKVSVTHLQVNQAIELAAREMLTSIHFKVPTAFGNKDLTVTGKSCDATEVLTQLSLRVCELVNSPDVLKLATIDESLGDGLLKPSGGIGGLVGNLLVHDEHTKLLKFTDNSETLEELSKRLFKKLESNMRDLRQYRFAVKAPRFPKLTFDSSDNDRRMAEDFLNRLLYFTSQADETRVGDILKGDIEDNICRKVNNFRVTSDALFLKYHDEIQTWWMAAEGDYLTKKSKKYEIAIEKIVSKPLMTVLSMMHQTKIGNNVEFTFSARVFDALTLASGTVVVTDSAELTVAKLIQRYQRQEHAVLDLEYALNLQANEYNTLCEELRDTDRHKMLIVVCKRKPSDRNWASRLRNVAEAVSDKFTVVATNRGLLEFVQEQFRNMRHVVHDEVANLADLTAASQQSVLKHATAEFQGQEVRLELMLDEESKRYVKGDVLKKVINNELITVSKLIGSLNYEKIKQVYIDRQIGRPNRTPTSLMSLCDVSDDVAVLIARPGMGKSTLLSHLSHRSKILNPNLWIVRVNLLDHSEQFNNWKDHKTDIDVLESLRFLCDVVLSDTARGERTGVELEERGGFVYLRHCAGDDSTAFEIEMFLHYYNTKNMMFLFDGFDEICPHYTREVLTFIKVIKSDFSLRLDPMTKIKGRLIKVIKGPIMWITSGPQENVKKILETQFGPSYELQMFPRPDQDRYLCLYWVTKDLLTVFTPNDLDNLKHIINFIENGLTTYKQSKDYGKFLNRHYSEALINFAFQVLKYLKQKIRLSSEHNLVALKSIINDLIIFVIHYVKDFYTPLHLYLVTVYIYNQIKNTNMPNKWNFEVNSEFTIYERFIDTELKPLCRKVTLSAINKNINFFDIHKKLGAVAIFNDDVEKIFTLQDVKNIAECKLTIKERKQKTGVICGILNDTPLFIYSTIAECFAVRHLCRLIKRHKNCNEKQKLIWDFILNILFLKYDRNIRDILNYKVQEDLVLREVIKKHESVVFDLLLTQGKGVFAYCPSDVSRLTYLKIKHHLEMAMSKDLFKFVEFLYDLKIMLTVDYFEKLKDYELKPPDST